MFKFNKNIKYADVLIPIIVFLLLVGLLFFVIGSLQIVSRTNKNNFTYTVKVRNTIEEIDKIVERAEVNLDVLVSDVAISYDTSKLNNEKYNISYVNGLGTLIRSVLMNSPSIDGAWFQINADLPFSGDVYSWYESKNGKIVDLATTLQKEQFMGRKLTPEEDPYYFKAVKAKKTVWSDVYTDLETQTRMMTISEPIYRKGVLIGVAGVDISIKNLQKALKKMQSVFKGSEVFLLDENKNIVLAQLLDNTKTKNINLSFLEALKKAKSNEEMVEYVDSGERKTSIMLALSNNYEVVITFPNSLIFKGFHRLFNAIYIILALLMSVAAINVFNRYKMIKINIKLESEKNALRGILEASPNIIMIKNMNGVYIDCNKKFLELKGLKKEDCIGKTVYDLFNEAEIDKIIKNEDLIKETKKSVVYEASYVNKNGETIYLEKHVVPLFTLKQELDKIFIIGIDITKSRLEQQHLEEARDSAETASKMKSNFLANMSHEIRTPMNGVLGFLQLLEDTNPTEEQSEFIGYALKSSELMLETINEILDFSKIEAGKLKIDYVSFDIRSLVEDVAIMNISNACKKGLDVNSLICSDVPQKVFGDPGRVKQILNNLIGNALKFTQEGEIVIYVSHISEQDGNVVLSFKVKDTGIGIPKEKLKLIFESFSQADSSTTRKYGGTGLGLAISQKLAELMKGHIHVESSVNEGSTFTITLPFKVDINSIQNPIPEIDDSSLSGKTILVVDHHCTDLKIIRYYLNEANCNIKEACSPEEALLILSQESQNISAIIIHYKMQRAGEVELSQLIKTNEKTKDIPLILYTSMANRGDAILAKEKGFKGYLTKPLKKHELIESLIMAMNVKNEYNHAGFITKHLIKEKKFDAKTKILMVEDTELNCKFITSLLNKFGLSCDIANEGKSAIEAFKSKKYDLILMDCQMPIMDGYEATREIRNIEGDSSHTPIIAMTANVLKTDEEKCYESGMDAYISKPINTEELLSLISKYVKIESESVASSTQKIERGMGSCINDSIEKMMSEVGFTEEEATKLFKEFLIYLSQSILELETLINQNEFENLRRLAHKLKGSGANLRIETIAKLSTQLENESLNENKEVCLNIVNQMKNHLEYLELNEKQFL